MSRIKRLVRPDTQALNWKAAVPALGLALACLAGAQTAIAAGAKDTQASHGNNVPVADFSTCKKPQYPQEALARNAKGTVTLGYLVAADGSVRDTAIRKSSGERTLDEAARVAIAKCAFAPAVENGKPVEKWVSVQYVWDPS